MSSRAQNQDPCQHCVYGIFKKFLLRSWNVGACRDLLRMGIEIAPKVYVLPVAVFFPYHWPSLCRTIAWHLTLHDCLHLRKDSFIVILFHLSQKLAGPTLSRMTDVILSSLPAQQACCSSPRLSH